MPLFRLTEKHVFPPPELAEKDGLLAVGGDLSEGRLLAAYSMGIFPWYSEDFPILWWSPDPRLVLMPGELKISRSLRQILRKGFFQVTFDTAFEQVITACAEMRRKREDGTWITPEMREAYIGLHKSGFAHSVEAWFEGELAGGLYGVAIGKAFFGESMFSHKSNASKIAFVNLVTALQKRNYRFIDCQVTTDHLISLGAREVPRNEFLSMLKEALAAAPSSADWSEEFCSKE